MSESKETQPTPTLVLYPGCHPTVPALAGLVEGRLWLFCSTCSQQIAEVALIRPIDPRAAAQEAGLAESRRL